MLKNYIHIAFRNLVKNKSYSLINLSGLTLSIAVFLIIGLYITNELSFDRHFNGSERIYRIVQEETSENRVYLASVPPGLGNAITDLFPEVESITELGLPNKRLLTVEGMPHFAEQVISVDKQFFDVFSFQVLIGNAKSALEMPGNIILTESLAKRMFGNKDPLGEIIEYENVRDVQVAAIVKDPPVNTHFTFDALTSLTTDQINDRVKDVRWQFFNAGFIYVKLKEGASAADFEEKLLAFEEKANKPEWMAGETNLAIQNLTSIHLGPNLGNEIAPQGNPDYLFLFGAIGIVLLALACINYMNLSSAKALQRLREVGVRKTLGANKSQLMAQFLTESILICFLTLPLAFMLTEAALPYINQLLGLRLSLVGNQYFPLLLMIPLITFLTGIISGSSPAFFLASLKPGYAINNIQSGNGQSFLKRSLVVFQFAAGIFLIISTITIYSQLNYVQEKNLGFDKEHVITFPLGQIGEQYTVFKEMLANEPSVVAVTSGPPAGLGRKNYTILVKDPVTQKDIHVNTLATDYDYAEAFGLKLKSGRLFSRSHATDPEKAILLTEEAARVLQFEKASVGDFIKFSGEDKQVIGIIEDYHNAALFREIQPVAVTLRPGNNWTGIVRLSAGNIEAGLAAVEAAWKSILPNRPFEFRFLDERIEYQYQKDQKLASLFTVFSLIALFIACLGLFGLAAFSAERRTKEIGIRKVMGATVASIVGLLSRDFVKLVLMGFVIAIPIAWYFMKQWLADFAYKIELGAGIFLVAGGVALVIAFLTVSWQSIKAANANPVKSLRSE